MQSTYIDETRDFVGDVDDLIGDLVTKRMCSDICPCPNNDYKESWLQMEEAVLNTYGRTKLPFSSQELVPLDFSGLGQKVYTNFEDCFMDIRKGDTSQARSEVQKYKESVKEGVLNFALDFSSFFENSYKCSGLCRPALFFYSVEIKEGRPMDPCLMILKDEISNNLSYMGISAILVGIVMMITWLTQYCLWKRFEYK